VSPATVTIMLHVNDLRRFQVAWNLNWNLGTGVPSSKVGFNVEYRERDKLSVT
jgi:hypothetical protein